MDQEPVRKNKLLTLVVIVLALALAVGLGYLLFTIFNTRTTAYLSKPFAQNINNPYKIDAEQLYFSTGHGFASLSTTTNKTSQLGQVRSLPSNPSSVQWTRSGVAMQASNYTIFDDLGKLVPATTIGSTDKPTYAWYVPFEGTPVVLDKNTSSLYADSNTGTIYYLWKINPAADGALLRTYSIKDGTRAQFMAQGISDPFRIVYTAGDFVWALVGYGEEVSLVKYGRNDQTTVIAKNVFNSKSATVRDPFAMINESFFVAVQQENGKAILATYDTAKQTRNVINRDFSGSVNRGSGSAIYANTTEGDKAVSIRITSADQIEKLSTTLPEGALNSSFDWGNNRLTINLLSQALILSTDRSATENLPEFKSAGLDKVINSGHQGSLYDLSIDLSNAATSNSYNANIYPPYEQNQAILFADITAAGYDPNQLDLTLNPTVIRR